MQSVLLVLLENKTCRQKTTVIQAKISVFQLCNHIELYHPLGDLYLRVHAALQATHPIVQAVRVRNYYLEAKQRNISAYHV